MGNQNQSATGQSQKNKTKSDGHKNSYEEEYARTYE